MGRRFSEISDEMIQEAKLLYARGLTQKQIAHYFGMCEKTFYKRVNEMPALQEALRRGKSRGIAHVTGKLFSQIDMGNVQCIMFYLRTQAGWRENDREEEERKVNDELRIDTSDPNEASKNYQAIMKEDD